MLNTQASLRSHFLPHATSIQRQNGHKHCAAYLQGPGRKNASKMQLNLLFIQFSPISLSVQLPLLLKQIITHNTTQPTGKAGPGEMVSSTHTDRYLSTMHLTPTTTVLLHTIQQC